MTLFRDLEGGGFLMRVPVLELADRFPVMLNLLEGGVVFSSGFGDCLRVESVLETLGLLLALANRGAGPGDHWRP